MVGSSNGQSEIIVEQATGASRKVSQRVPRRGEGAGPAVHAERTCRVEAATRVTAGGQMDPRGTHHAQLLDCHFATYNGL